MTDISISIVAYNNEEDVKKAVCSIMEHTALSISKKIYLIDNSDRPNTLSDFAGQFSEVIYQKTPSNIGFGAGHNYCLQELDSVYHAIVNPDILLTEDSLQILMSFMEKKKAGMVIPRMVDEQGNPQAACRRELTVLDVIIRHVPFLFRKRKAYHTMQEQDSLAAYPVPFAQGSFLVIRTALFKELGGFDERYFMYAEDADLCKRVSQSDSIYYCPDTTVIHKWERSSHRDSRLRKQHLHSLVLYFRKWGWKLW